MLTLNVTSSATNFGKVLVRYVKHVAGGKKAKEDRPNFIEKLLTAD